MVKSYVTLILQSRHKDLNFICWRWIFPQILSYLASSCEISSYKTSWWTWGSEDCTDEEGVLKSSPRTTLKRLIVIQLTNIFCSKENSPESIPPALIGHHVVLAPGSEVFVVRQSVVAPPYSRGHVVSQDHINGVVTPGQEQEHHSTQRHQERGPVKQFEVLWWV